MNAPRPNLVAPTGQQNYKSVRVNTYSPTSAKTPKESSTAMFGPSISTATTSVGSPTHLPTPSPKISSHQAIRRDVHQPMLRIVTDPKMMPTPSVLSSTLPIRDFDQPSHRYPVIRRVDSKSESKSSDASRPYTEAPIEFVGTSYTNVANAHRVNFQPPPLAPTLPKPFAPLVAKDFAGSPMLSNRTASGRILGAAAKRLIAPSHVPALPVEEPVGPENPYHQLNDTWTKCWDNEAGAVYYYNNITGEATWMPPEL